MSSITVYGTPVCPKCKDVIEFLESLSVDHEYKTVGVDVTKEELEEVAGRAVRSVPVIIFNEEEVTFADLRDPSMYSTLLSDAAL